MGVGPTEDAWSRLGLYKSRDVLERRYRGRHGLEVSADKANEIIAHFEQGQQYFQSAQSAGVLAGPLEQYYGILAIARGMVLFLDPVAREATIKKGHGLRATLQGNASIEDVQILVEDGTFREFLQATKNVEQATVDELLNPRYAPKNYPVVRSLPQPGVGARFSFRDLIARISGVRRQFEEAFDITGGCFQCNAWLFNGALNISISWDRAALPSGDELAKFLRVHPRATKLREFDAASKQYSISFQQGDTLVSLLPHVVDSLDRDQHTVVAPFQDGWVLSELAGYFAAAHVMSTLVRYHPTRWARLLAHEKGDRIVSVLERLRVLIQTDFVRLVLWELERPAAQGCLVWS